jgi:hypothetical protein
MSDRWTEKVKGKRFAREESWWRDFATYDVFCQATKTQVDIQKAWWEAMVECNLATFTGFSPTNDHPYGRKLKDEVERDVTLKFDQDICKKDDLTVVGVARHDEGCDVYTLCLYFDPTALILNHSHSPNDARFTATFHKYTKKEIVDHRIITVDSPRSFTVLLNRVLDFFRDGYRGS